MRGTVSLNSLFYFSIFFLLFTPSIGIVYTFTGFHISNERLGFFILCLNAFFIKRIPLKIDFFFYFSIFLTLIFLFGVFFRSQYSLGSQDIAYLLFPFQIYFYLLVASRERSEFIKMLSLFVKLSIILFWIQLIFKAIIPELIIEDFFINNPIQNEYRYPRFNEYLYRVSGTFNESSQIGILFAASLFFVKEYYLKIILIFSVIFTLSSTALAMLIFYLLHFFFKNFSFSKFYLFAVLLTIFSFVAFPSIFSSFEYKFLSTISFDEPRIIYLFDNFNRSLDSPLLGIGADLQDSNRWDFFSVYFLSFGYIIGFFYLLYLLYIFKGYPIIFISPVLFTNASITNPVIIILVLIGVLSFSNDMRFSNSRKSSI